MDNPLAQMTFIEQARQFSVSIVGPLRKTSVPEALEPLGFDNCDGEFRKQEPDKDALAAVPFENDSGNYVLIYNETKLQEWREEWLSILGLSGAGDTEATWCELEFSR